MEKQKQQRTPFDITISPNDGHKRSAEETAKVDAFARAHHQNRSSERLLKNAMLAVRYRMEFYIEDAAVTPNQIRTIKDFANEFLEVLKLKKGDFAAIIEIDQSNLNKYYKEDRRFNAELAMKFGHFFHTPADLWLRVQFKNEMLLFQMEAKAEKKYEKYDYQKFLHSA